MKLFVAVLATTAALANADGKSAAARFNKLRRQLSYSEIAGYKPGSQVTDHCALDLDQAAMEAQLAFETPESFANAKAIYENGGHSKSYARIRLDAGLKGNLAKSGEILGKNAEGTQIKGKAGADHVEGDTELKVYYATTDVQESYVGCRVGSLLETKLDGCFTGQGVLTIGGEDYSYTYDQAADNKAGRTLKGFSTAAGDKMRTGCKGCPYGDFQAFYNYYGRDDYGDHWIQSAFDQQMTDFKNGNADFSKYGFKGQEQAIKKGTAYLNVFMYVIREFEDALDDCEVGSLDNNYDAVHAWDEGVCFYAGSLEGTEGASQGKLLHELADKRCKNFRTCGEQGTDLDGMSQINHHLFDLFDIGNHQLESKECTLARGTVRDIVNLMYVPMIQGMLRYAYKVSELQGGEVEEAEGAVFAAAFLPKVHAVSPTAASTIYENMKVNSQSTNFREVKAAVESVYPDMGITCADVGGLWFEGKSEYYEGMEPCTDGDAAAVKSDEDSAGSRLAGAVASLCISAALLFVGF